MSRLASLLVALTVATAALAARPAVAEESSRLIVFLKPGPRWDHGRRFALQGSITGHRAHYQKAAKAGKVTLVGPISGQAMALVVAAPGMTRAELKELVRADPAVKAQTFVYEIQEWKLDVDATPKPSASDDELDESYGDDEAAVE